MAEDEWLNLSAAAEVLGVHPSTVRNWSDSGELPVHRTSGGHRRYRRSEIELWMETRRAVPVQDDLSLMLQRALGRTRFQISEGAIAAEGWYQKLDEDARRNYRASGRALLQGLFAYIGAQGESARAEARSIGYEYASRAHSYNLCLTESIHAFLFFRNTLMEAMFSVYESAAVRSPIAWSEMMRKVQNFTDLVMLTMIETYSAYERR